MIIILRGIPCSGKSTYTQEFLKDNPNYIVISNDIVDILDQIGKKIGAIKNKETDYDRVYKKVIKDLQDGYLGNITFDEIIK